MAARLLLVDDEPRNLALLEAFLGPSGYSCTRAGSGQKALEIFERDGADLILLDVMMPDFDGLDVLAHVRAHERGAHVPVILVTGQTERESRLRGFEAGADEFLEKPVDRALLLARVRTLLRLKEANDELVRRNALLERLQREQREMTGFIVHDLKNPLAIVHVNLDWVMGELRQTDADVTEALTHAVAASARLQRMLGDLLAVARIEQLDAPIDRTRVAVEGLLQDVAKGHGREAQSKRATLSVEVEAGLSVRGDRALLERVVENLVQNALRYTPQEGRILLSARRGPPLEITVSNTGRPIPPRQRARLFEKFRRGEGESISAGHAGLGLYFCRRVMGEHGGTVAVVDVEPWPTTFALRFPGDQAELEAT